MVSFDLEVNFAKFELSFCVDEYSKRRVLKLVDASRLACVYRDESGKFREIKGARTIRVKRARYRNLRLERGRNDRIFVVLCYIELHGKVGWLHINTAVK
jgi:hypothetical protein